MNPTLHAPDEILLGFARALRSAGVPVTHDRATTFLTATSLVGVDDRRHTYWSGRATLCAGPDDLARYDQVFEAWFGSREGLPRSIPREQSQQVASPLPADEETGDGATGESETLRAAASTAEVLRHRDVAALEPHQKALLDAMIRSLRPRPPLRRDTRRTPWRRGEIDLGRTLRRTLEQMGEPGRTVHRRRGTQPRRVVLLVDVSASMRPYADALLRLCHRISTGTRLTRITRAMHTADAERALVRAGDEVPDWSGGTRLGETLAAFLDRWGARGMARGAVVVVFSDGWERGDATQLGEQMQRLHRLAHKVVWVNPHRGKEGYEPLQQGILAVLPYCHEFVAGHSLRSFEQVLEVIGDA